MFRSWRSWAKSRRNSSASRCPSTTQHESDALLSPCPPPHPPCSSPYPLLDQSGLQQPGVQQPGVQQGERERERERGREREGERETRVTAPVGPKRGKVSAWSAGQGRGGRGLGERYVGGPGGRRRWRNGRAEPEVRPGRPLPLAKAGPFREALALRWAREYGVRDAACPISTG